VAAEVRSPFFFPLSFAPNKYKSPCGAEGEEKARFPQELNVLFYTILFLLSIQPENVKPRLALCTCVSN
jgi:hypothetical protein